jgi:hypothetical protein
LLRLRLAMTEVATERTVHHTCGSQGRDEQ